MEKLTARSRVPNTGGEIACPECGAIVTVYHLAWSALGCQQCGAMVNKTDWYKAESRIAPTVDDVLSRCDLRSFDEEKEQLLEWDGCAIPVGKLRAALEAAYDPTMPNWPATVEVEP
jgi:hypothetical protein